jgi:hypothetical protein
MWFGMAEWVKAGGCNCRICRNSSRNCRRPTYTFVNGKFQIEPKEQVKERSGDHRILADALALTFGMPEDGAD